MAYGSIITCPHCHRCELLPSPISIEAMTPWIVYFQKQHRACQLDLANQKG